MILKRSTLGNLKQYAEVDVSFSDIVNTFIYDPLCITLFVPFSLAQVNVELLLNISIVNE